LIPIIDRKPIDQLKCFHKVDASDEGHIVKKQEKVVIEVEVVGGSRDGKAAEITPFRNDERHLLFYPGCQGGLSLVHIVTLVPGAIGLQVGNLDGGNPCFNEGASAPDPLYTDVGSLSQRVTRAGLKKALIDESITIIVLPVTDLFRGGRVQPIINKTITIVIYSIADFPWRYTGPPGFTAGLNPCGPTLCDAFFFIPQIAFIGDRSSTLTVIVCCFRFRWLLYILPFVGVGPV
jgi:hypothetical protein